MIETHFMEESERKCALAVGYRWCDETKRYATPGTRKRRRMDLW